MKPLKLKTAIFAVLSILTIESLALAQTGGGPSNNVIGPAKTANLPSSMNAPMASEAIECRTNDIDGHTFIGVRSETNTLSMEDAQKQCENSPSGNTPYCSSRMECRPWSKWGDEDSEANTSSASSGNNQHATSSASNGDDFNSNVKDLSKSCKGQGKGDEFITVISKNYWANIYTDGKTGLQWGGELYTSGAVSHCKGTAEKMCALAGGRLPSPSEYRALGVNINKIPRSSNFTPGNRDEYLTSDPTFTLIETMGYPSIGSDGFSAVLEESSVAQIAFIRCVR